MRRSVHQRSVFAVLVAFMVAFLGLGASAAVAAPDLQTVPFRVTQVAHFETIGFCDGGAGYYQEIWGTGQASRLGRFESHGFVCTTAMTNDITWTAANGDEITITYWTELGDIGPDGSAPIAFHAVGTTGTGRFAQVELGCEEPLAGTVWFAPDGSGHMQVSMVGTITYQASDRSDG